MIVYKFGGASVSSPSAIENLAGILSRCSEKMIVVISAFGKMTNALEGLLNLWVKGSTERFVVLESIKKYHLEIIDGLFKSDKHPVYNHFGILAGFLEEKLKTVPSGNYDLEYDQMVSMGEVISTRIVSFYLDSVNIGNRWVDAREWMVTDDTYREANVDFMNTGKRLRKLISSGGPGILITQGFIGGTANGLTTTLGREGSDYSAAIAANLIDAGSLVVWKDVPGVLTADPKYFPDAEKLEELSYQEAIELSFYGAKVIHPKTIKPLQNKEIPLFVKSFIDPDGSGTLIHAIDRPAALKPILIVKKDQILASLTPRDFSFVVEERLGRIFSLFFKYRMKVNLIQHSAISITICMDNRGPFVQDLIEHLRNDFRVLYNEGLDLITIRHYTSTVIDKHTAGREILVEQRSRNTAMYVVR